MLTNHYSSFHNVHNTRELTLNDLTQYLRIGQNSDGLDQLVIRVTSPYGSPEYISIADMLTFLRDFNNHYNSNIEIINRELKSVEPATDIIERIEKLEFLIEEN